MKKHLLEGVKKGAFDEAEATKRFDEWIKQNEAKIEAKKSNLEKSQDDELGKKLSVEKRVNEARVAKLARKNADLAAKAAAGEKAEAVAEEAAPDEETTSSPAPEEETTPSPVTEETSSEPVAEDKPQE
jgi:small subunit ribosomal protein S16